MKQNIVQWSDPLKAFTKLKDTQTSGFPHPFLASMYLAYPSGVAEASNV